MQSCEQIIVRALKALTMHMNRATASGSAGLSDEFAQLAQEHTELLMRSTFDIALRDDNDWKNRYYDILPYDNTRVVLRGTPSDYIHAVCVSILNYDLVGLICAKDDFSCIF